jgi:hypothetical protein
MKKAQLADIIMGILFMALAVFWFMKANKMVKVEFGIGPGGYPKFISVGLFILALFMTVQSIRKGLPKLEIKIDRKALLRQIIFFAVTFAYIRLMRVMGFLILTPLYLFFQCWFFGYRKYIIAAIISIGLTAGIYYTFQMIFLIMLPRFRLF